MTKVNTHLAHGFYHEAMSTPQSSTHIHQARLLQARTQLLERIAAQRGGARSRVDMAAEHDLRAWDAHAQASTELNEEFALNEHETAELVAIDAALALQRAHGFHHSQVARIAVGTVSKISVFTGPVERKIRNIDAASATFEVNVSVAENAR